MSWFDFYYHLMACKGKGTQYYVEAWEIEAIYQ